MLKKITLFAILVLLMTLTAQYYSIHRGSIIILTQSTKVTINLAMGITLLVIGFILFHYALRIIAFLRFSPKNWRKYRQEKYQNKHREILKKALIYHLNDQQNQAEHQFKQGYLVDPNNNYIDLLMAVQTELHSQQTAKAQNDLSEIQERDPQIKETIAYLQAKIYQQKDQPTSAISSIKQIKNYLKKPQLLQRLCQSLIASQQYHELLEFLSHRSALSASDKKSWGICAHTHIMDQFLSQNQILETLRYFNQIPSFYNKEPAILCRYHHALLLNNNSRDLIKSIEKNIFTLFDKSSHEQMIDIITNINEKEILNRLETQLNQYINTTTNDKSPALRCRAHVFINKHYYEKAIADYQAIVNLNISPASTVSSRLAIFKLEKKILHKQEAH